MDKGVTKPLYGFYRAKVVDNIDKEQYGKVRVWIPDLMINIPDTEGIWAYPANNPVGGRNTQFESDHHYMGTSYIPKIGSFVFIFFETGNVNRPYYFGSLDIQQSKVLPENRVGSNPSDKWTIFKSHEGRVIVISDDPDDARVEITGKKRQLKEPPAGDTESVYTIDKNQTTILLDERPEKEKILIRTHKGDFINIDVEKRQLHIEFESDVHIKTNGKFFLTAKESIHVKTESTINVEANDAVNIKTTGLLNLETGDVINIKAIDNINIESGGSMNLKCPAKANIDAGSDLNLKSGENLTYSATQNVSGLAGLKMSHDATTLMEQSGTSIPADGATGAGGADKATTAEPKGDRD